MSWKLISGILFALLVMSNAWFLYGGIDKGVTDAYREHVLYELANQVKASSRICDLFVDGKSQAEIVAVLKDQFPDEEPFVKVGAVNVAWLSISLGADGNAQSCILEESTEEWARREN